MEPTWRIRGVVFNKVLPKNPFGTLVCLLVLLWVTVVTVDLVEGKNNDGDAINWAYQESLDDGFYFGTQENAQVYDLPLSYTFRSLENDDWGLELKFPITIGLYNIDSEKNPVEVNSQWEIGITLSTIPNWKIWFFEIERLGMGYRFGNNFNAVRLVFGMPF